MKIGIIGLGLIGGSLARAIKKNNIESEIVAFDRVEDELTNAIKEKNIDSYTTKIDSNFYECDIIFLCTPVDVSIRILDDLEQIVNEKCLITDVSSTKSEIMSFCYNNKKINFIGGHPMTGSEKSGYSNSSEILFENAFYIVTPLKGTNNEYLILLKDIITRIGAIYIEMSAEEHDECLSIISHIPHILASCLVNYLKDIDNDREIYKQLCAGGFKDITRIASSNGELWYSIIESNRENILRNFRKFIDEQETIYEMIKNSSKDIVEYINNGKTYRDSIEDKTSPLRLYEITVDVKDRPNVIGEVATLLGKNNCNIKNIGINNNRDDYQFALTVAFENESILEKASKILYDSGYNCKKI